MAQRGARRGAWKPAFLVALDNTYTVTAACEAVGVARATVYEARQKDEDFAAASADVEEKITERIERKAIRRGVEGVDRPVYQGKELVGTVREYSVAP